MANLTLQGTGFPHGGCIPPVRRIPPTSPSPCTAFWNRGAAHTFFFLRGSCRSVRDAAAWVPGRRQLGGNPPNPAARHSEGLETAWLAGAMRNTIAVAAHSLPLSRRLFSYNTPCAASRLVAALLLRPCPVLSLAGDSRCRPSSFSFPSFHSFLSSDVGCCTCTYPNS